MRTRAIVVFLVVSYSIQAAEADKPQHPSFVKKAVGKPALIRAGVGAAIGQIRNSPREWGRGASGLGKRVASSVGTHVVKVSVETAVATWRHEDLSYRPSGKEGFRPRLQYVLLSTVVARKTTTGKPTVASGRISGALASGMVSRLWQPVRLRTVGSGFATAGVALGVDAGVHVTREFWPEIRHPRRRP